MRSKKFQMVDAALIPTTQEATEHQFLVDLLKHLDLPTFLSSLIAAAKLYNLVSVTLEFFLRFKLSIE